MKDTKLRRAQEGKASPKKADKRGEGGGTKRAAARIISNLNTEDEGGRPKCTKTMS